MGGVSREMITSSCPSWPALRSSTDSLSRPSVSRDFPVSSFAPVAGGESSVTTFRCLVFAVVGGSFNGAIGACKCPFASAWDTVGEDAE